MPTAPGPGCGRSACTCWSNARMRPAKASMVIAAARSAVSSKSSIFAAASTPVASICAVPLFSARPSLCDRRIGARPARRKASRARQSLALVEGFAATQQHDRQMRQRRQVAAGADRSLLRHHRHDAGVEHGGQRLQRADANAGMTAHQGVDADDQHRAHHFGGERLADADRMGDDQVALQFLEQAFVLGLGAGHAGAQAVRAEQLVGIAAEAGGDAVDRLLAARPARPGNRRRAAPSSVAPHQARPSRHRPPAITCSRVRDWPSRWIDFISALLHGALLLEFDLAAPPPVRIRPLRTAPGDAGP